jgi:hypothetical protein
MENGQTRNREPALLHRIAGHLTLEDLPVRVHRESYIGKHSFSELAE